MEKQELMKIVEQYHDYWRTYIQPMIDREPKRYVHFTDTLTQVGRHFYGSKFSLEFCLAVLYSVFEEPSGEAISDETQQGRR